MNASINSAQMARMSELDMESEPILCTAVANVLSEFGETELLYVAISTSSDGTLIYHNSLVTVTSTSGRNMIESNPVSAAVKKLLSNSDKYCNVKLGSDQGFPYILVEVID